VGFKEASIASRLDGIPVYAVSNEQGEIVLVSAPDAGRSLGLICFKKEDAEAILQEMRGMDKEMRHEGSRVVPLALDKVNVVIDQQELTVNNLISIYNLMFYENYICSQIK
jgi:Tic22-like family